MRLPRPSILWRLWSRGLLLATTLAAAWPGCCHEVFNEDGTMFWACPWPWSLLT